MMNERRETACGQIQSRDRYRQIETPWPSTSRVEIEHRANSLDPGPMRVAGNDDVDPARDWIELQCLDVVQNMDANPAKGYRLRLRIMFRPVAGIDIASDRNDRRDPPESGDNAWRTDIAGVDDVVHPREVLLDIRAQQPVSVRDDSNSGHAAISPAADSMPVRLYSSTASFAKAETPAPAASAGPPHQ